MPYRLQWRQNLGYCGEVSLISAGLYYGQYLSQYDVRALITYDGSQTGGQLLIGENDTDAADLMHLEYEEWDTDSQETTDEFLVWIKQQIVAGYPTIIGLFANQYRFYESTDPLAGDTDYDHIVPVIDVSSNHPLSSPTYYGDDSLGFSDNGLWKTQTPPIYYFNYAFAPFQTNREEANAPSGPVYSLNNNATNYGIAITGIKDLNGDTVPVRIETYTNYEKPDIVEHSNTRPLPITLVLTITISELELNVPYILYRYDDLDLVPDSEFNANAANAYESWSILSRHHSTYILTEIIRSNETAVYRCVKASAP
jgi:hypothetical protein